MFHRHTWELVEKKEQPSRGEIARSTGLTRINGLWDMDGFFTRPMIVTYHCACGADKVKRI